MSSTVADVAPVDLSDSRSFVAGVPHAYLAYLRRHDPVAESVVLQGVGHALFVDNPGSFNELVRDFIGRRVWP